ncbi:hypothetical protein [Desulfovibrio ferrophilus]|uniref:Uncharacterized protein n=1 Tax=Desulfovibrio ferrophilus TaxID=241368 RepID=A0A2Z6B051_9BACT|nr:hypothetical protein [Desulfovibrio ferrophilus]BBD08756.1 uncharacterized protein DFE_2030 [Desulfovibrio ferrophilus]
MGGSGIGKSVPSVTSAPAPVEIPPTPAEDEGSRELLEAARQREEERRRKQARATVATGAQGDLGTANVGKSTLG